MGEHCGHIRKRDGLLGLWRGVTPKMLSLAVAHLASDKFNQLYPPEPELKEEEEEAMSMEEKQERFVRMTLRDIACKMTCVIVSQPLQVLAVRSMAEFVGGEDKFSGGLTAGLYGGCVSIIQENGILGFWSGLVPRMLGEVGILGLPASITYLVNNYLLDDEEMKQYTGHVAGFLAGSLCYPLQVTSTCMTVSRFGLMAGYPPRMPLYTGSRLSLPSEVTGAAQERQFSNIQILHWPSGNCWRPGHSSQLEHVQVTFKTAVKHITLYLNASSSH